jgi:DNA-binding beta-propeller fold protein YncE
VPPPNGRLANYPNGIVADADGVWVIDEQGRSMWKVDPDLARVSAIFRVDGPIAIAIGERAVWTANNDGTISRIDPSTAMPVETVPLGRYPRIAYPVALAVGNGAVWVAVH